MRGPGRSFLARRSPRRDAAARSSVRNDERSVSIAASAASLALLPVVLDGCSAATLWRQRPKARSSGGMALRKRWSALLNCLTVLARSPALPARSNSPTERSRVGDPLFQTCSSDASSASETAGKSSKAVATATTTRIRDRVTLPFRMAGPVERARPYTTSDAPLSEPAGVAVEARAVVLAVVMPRAELAASKAPVLSADDRVGPAAPARLGHGDGRAADRGGSGSRDAECDDGGGGEGGSRRFMELVYSRSAHYRRASGDAQAPIRGIVASLRGRRSQPSGMHRPAARGDPGG